MIGMINNRGLREILNVMAKERKREDIKEIFEKKKVTSVKIAPHKTHPEPITKRI
jgi:hypothetical protein